MRSFVFAFECVSVLQDEPLKSNEIILGLKNNKISSDCTCGCIIPWDMLFLLHCFVSSLKLIACNQLVKGIEIREEWGVGVSRLYKLINSEQLEDQTASLFAVINELTWRVDKAIKSNILCMHNECALDTCFIRGMVEFKACNERKRRFSRHHAT